MSIENLLTYENAFYAGTKFKEEPELSLDLIVNFLKDGSKGSKISLDSYWNRVKAEAEVEIDKYGTFRGGIAESIQEYSSKYQKEFESSSISEIVEYGGIKISDEEKSNFEANKYVSTTYKELNSLAKDKDKLKEMSKEDQRELAVALNLANMSREYKFNELEYKTSKKRMEKTAKELLKTEENKEDKK